MATATQPSPQKASHAQSSRQQNLNQPGLSSWGFTLIELLIWLSIIGTLSLLLVPRLLGAMPDLALTQQTHQLQSLLSNARILAMVRGTSTIVCPATVASLDPRNVGEGLADAWCDPHGNWQAGVNVVLDQDRNGSIDEADSLVLQLAWRTGQGLPPQVQWRGFRDMGQIEFLATGMTNWQNGRFILCSDTHPIPGKHLVLNAAGRSYIQAVASEDCG